MLTDLNYLFLLPVAAALAFMIWVLWNVTMQLRPEKRSARNEPVISVDMTGRMRSRNAHEASSIAIGNRERNAMWNP
jgi:hypothetical protein